MSWFSPGPGRRSTRSSGIEVRGFILGGAVAHQVSAGFVPIRKKGKLPHKRVSIAYSLEYGLDEMEMHEDAVENGDRVVLVDDLIATGGTAEGAVKLLRRLGAEVLPDLGGADRVRKLDVPVRTPSRGTKCTKCWHYCTLKLDLRLLANDHSISEVRPIHDAFAASLIARRCGTAFEIDPAGSAGLREDVLLDQHPVVR
jgi:adenine phosphoribosyltransferase